ncbi:hypothetical protein SNEBB_006209 [Seison nebaliae]|nr:hypothetical protein SNEBB_006209 [Seison nebaliae]
MSNDQAKKNVGYAAVEGELKGARNDMIIGIGSGSTVVYVIEALAKKMKDESWRMIGIPTSFQSQQLLRKHKIPQKTLEEEYDISITFDGADECTMNELNIIKGGGACQLGEKMVAFNSKKLVIVADESKFSEIFGSKFSRGIPIEVIPVAANYIMGHISRKYKSFTQSIDIRMAKEKAGPVITDNGNFIIDWKIIAGKMINNKWKSISNELISIPGIVETGLYIGMADIAYSADSSGKVQVYTKK